MSEDNPNTHRASQPAGDDTSGDATPTKVIPPRVADEAYLAKLRVRQAEQDRRQHRRYVLYGVLGVIGVVLVLFVGSVVKVVLDANGIVSSAKAIPAALLQGDSDTLNEEVANVKRDGADLNFVVNTPVWNAGCALPGLGQDFKNLQQLSGILNDVSDDVLDPLASDSGEIAGNDVMSEDQINVSALLKVARIVQNLTPALSNIASTTQSLERGVIPQVNDAVAMIKTYSSQLMELSDKLDGLVNVLPGLLGAEDTPKSYLLIAQNSAELRPTGGIPGAWGVVTVDNGKIKIGDLGHPDNVSRDSTPAIALTASDYSIMGDYYGYMKPDIFWVSSNFDPDFSNSAQHFETYWALLVEQGITGSSDTDLPEDVDGVVAVNPIFVQRLLSLTDGYDVDGKHIDGDNAAKVMLHDAYWDFSPEDQDGYFGKVASGAMSTIMGGLTDMDFSGLMSVLQDAASRGDLVMYFDDPATEQVVEDFGVDGKVSNDETSPILGTYFYDITWSKMDWYLNSSTTIGDATQNSDGSVSYQVTTTLINEMTEDEAQNAPDYVTGFMDDPLVKNRGGMATVVMLFAPAGGRITNLQCNTQSVSNFSEYVADGLNIYNGVIVLDPQRKSTITYTVTTSPNASSQLTVRSTPTLVEIAGWQDDGKPDSDFQEEDGSSYGGYSAEKVDQGLSSSGGTGSGRRSSSSSSNSNSTSNQSSGSSSSSSSSSSRTSYSGATGSSSSSGSFSYQGYSQDDSGDYSSSVDSGYDDESSYYYSGSSSGSGDYSSYSGDSVETSADDSYSDYGYSDQDE